MRQKSECIGLCIRVNFAKAEGTKLKSLSSRPEYGSQLPEASKMRKQMKYIKTTEEAVRRLSRGIVFLMSIPGGGL